MAKRETQTLSFTPEQAAFVRDCVKSGRYQSASEVVRAALRLLEAEETRLTAEREHVRRLLQEGVEQLDRGETVDADDVFGALANKHAALDRGTPPA